MKENIKKIIKCAVYTRKSTEDGLEQDFNSLDAQREACEAYIKSQQHEGWVLVEKDYNDGGYSGGTLDRPAVQKLFKDIEAGEIDIIVVYKVDRLTRSLMDFVKIVELFDKNNASFVSVTQAFNTTTSMGRLTLNMLLSFAQFEREVTGERIRDKIAASKKRGMWMGGCVPIGYQRVDKKLVIEDIGAEKTKLIFSKYLELKSVQKLKNYLDETGIKTRSNKNFSKGQLYHMLSNKVYTGKIVHKENIYDGEHESIIDDNIFEEVEKLLLKNRVDANCNTKSASNSLLIGKIYDDKNNRMTTSHSNTRKRKYRYYVSLAVQKLKKGQEGSLSKISAGEIEKFVVNAIKELLLDKYKIQPYITNFDIATQQSMLNAISNIDDFYNPKLVRSILSKVVVSKEFVEIALCEKGLVKMLGNIVLKEDLTIEAKEDTNYPIVIHKKVKILQPSRTGNILIINANEKNAVSPNPFLVRAVVKSHYWNRLLLEGTAKNVADILKLEGLNDKSYVRDILRLKFIPPNLTEQILNGIQPRDLNMKKLFSQNI